MSQANPYRNYAGLIPGLFLISMAVAVLVAWRANDWVLLFPVLLVELGLGGIGMGLMIRRQPQPFRFGPPEPIYLATVGSFVLIVGSIWLLNALVPGNLPALVAVFFVAVGALSVVLSISGRSSPRGG